MSVDNTRPVLCASCGEPESDDIHSTYGRHEFERPVTIHEASIKGKSEAFHDLQPGHGPLCTCNLSQMLRDFIKYVANA